MACHYGQEASLTKDQNERYWSKQCQKGLKLEYGYFYICLIPKKEQFIPTIKDIKLTMQKKCERDAQTIENKAFFSFFLDIRGQSHTVD